MVARNCLECGKKFNAKTSQHYCTKLCLNRNKRKRKWFVDMEKRRKEKVAELRAIAEKLIGNACFLCGSTKNVCFHEKYGNKHEWAGNPRALRFIIENKEDFVPICRNHHTALHKIAKISDREKFMELLALL